MLWVGLWVEKFSPVDPAKPFYDENHFNEKLTFRPSEIVSVNTCAFGRSRTAADASREVEERWLLDGL